MRHSAPGLMGLALAAIVSACAPIVHPVDPEDAAERAAAGAVLGAALGTGLGATFAINPGLGSVIGVEAGAGVGAAIGAITAAPTPDYHPVAVPATAVIPGFYDGWAPGYHSLPGNPETQPPPAG